MAKNEVRMEYPFDKADGCCLAVFKYLSKNTKNKGRQLAVPHRGAFPSFPQGSTAAQNIEQKDSVRKLRELLNAARGSAVVLTGAGMSTDSGIPDYRGPRGSYSRGHKPMTHDEFLSSEGNRRR